jgi:hypothetical protein
LRRCGVESLLENRNNRLWLEASGREDTSVGPMGWCRCPRTGTSRRSDALSTIFLIFYINITHRNYVLNT